MLKYLTINENKQILKYYKKKYPKTKHGIKKKVSVLIFQKMCKSNCDIDENFKRFLSIIYKKRMISPNNKNKYKNTVKSHNTLSNKYKIMYHCFCI